MIVIVVELVISVVVMLALACRLTDPSQGDPSLARFAAVAGRVPIWVLLGAAMLLVLVVLPGRWS